MSAANVIGRPWRLARLVITPSPVAMRRLALAALITSSIIVVSGAAVRLSSSGLGCTTWPDCTGHSLVAAGATGDSLIHRWVEFGNRLVTVAITLVAFVVGIAGWRFRDPGTGRRRADIRWLAFTLPAGILADAVIGGIVVLTKLNPYWVSVHFMFSMALVAVALGLYMRSREGNGPARALVRREVIALARGLAGALALMIAVGTVVTGTGPLAGAADVPRYPLPRTGVTQLHADIGWLLGGLLVGLIVALQLAGAPQRARRRAWLLGGLVVVQGCIGYAQYFAGLPAGLVWVHVTGALLIWITALSLIYALRDRGQMAAGAAAPAASVSTAGAAPGLEPSVISPAGSATGQRG